MSHFSDIGFVNFSEDNFLDKIKELVSKFEDRVLDFTKDGNGYLGLFLTNRLDIYLQVIDSQIRVDTLAFHHNNDSYVFLNSFEEINKEEGLYRIDYDEFAMNVNVPCSFYKLDYDEKKKYMCQLALYAESIDVFDSEEAFHQTKFGLTMNHESLLPEGMFDEEQNSTILLTGIIKKIEHMTNPFEMDEYFKVTVKCLEHTYECFLDSNEAQKIKEGQIISGIFYVTGKIMEKYHGSEFGDIKRKETKESKIQTIDDLFNVLWHSWDKMTAHPNVRECWMKYDRCCGQCAITAALVYDMFGGEIHKVKLPNGDTHYYNVIDGHVIDLTSYEGDLYSDPYILEVDPIKVDRDYLNKNKDTVQRYIRLTNNVFNYLKS